VRGEARVAIKARQTDSLGLGGQPTALLVVEPRLLAQLFLENPHLLLQVFDDILLVAVNPTSQTKYKELKRIHLAIMRNDPLFGQSFRGAQRKIPQLRVFGQYASTAAVLHAGLLRFPPSVGERISRPYSSARNTPAWAQSTPLPLTPAQKLGVSGPAEKHRLSSEN
jgi:hypothetical protein